MNTLPAVDWPTVLAKLRERGWTHRALATVLGCRPALLSDLNQGNQGDTSFVTGRALMAIHDAGLTPPSEPTAAAGDVARKLTAIAESLSPPTPPKRRERSVRAVQ